LDQSNIMEPFQRLKNTTEEGNLWIYILVLGCDREVVKEKLGALIFQRFGFLPSGFTLATVLYRLALGGYISEERFQSQAAYKTSVKGLEELKKAKAYISKFSEKMAKEMGL